MFSDDEDGWLGGFGGGGRSLNSGGPTVPTNRLFKENAPFIFFILMGPFARTLFSRTLLP